MPKIFAVHKTGFRIELDDVSRGQLDAAIDWLIEHGFQPDLPGDGWRKTPSGEPICGKHNIAMTKREKQSDVWYSHKIIDSRTGEILYCRGYSTGNEADGYNL